MEGILRSIDRQAWGLLLLVGAVSIIIGILILVWPRESLTVLIGLTGMLLMLGGALGIVLAFGASLNHQSWGWELCVSLLSVLVGLVLLKWPAPTVVIYVLSLGVWAVASGFIGLAGAMVYHAELPHAWLLGLGCCLTVLFGLVVLAVPPIGLKVFVALTGMLSIILGVILAIVAFQVRSLGRPHAEQEQTVSGQA